ncbi:hypothetical protein CDCA_CDCA18G4596 [Cyanidium caldarium]|uniref:Meiotic nuclear division protein 1 homolog n=1 Tax=Cyanidium caldarium TaxID=2771 RepID=A0AAV9J2P2_CYACA|nr:hypothetical protein CDCA_CDCA18G4596 [Cyanidium caldarium]
MSRKRGLCFDEKRTRLLEIFTETSEFYTLKELEKVAPKSKGITLQSVKEVLQCLVDDDLVNMDKCGVNTIYWCLPSESVQKKRHRLAAIERAVADKKALQQRLQEQVAEARRGREASAHREQVLERLQALDQQWSAREAELQELRRCDPEHLDALVRETATLKERANRWTDNLYTVRAYVRDQFGVQLEVFDEQFGTERALQYVE